MSDQPPSKLTLQKVLPILFELLYLINYISLFISSKVAVETEVTSSPPDQNARY